MGTVPLCNSLHHLFLCTQPHLPDTRLSALPLLGSDMHEHFGMLQLLALLFPLPIYSEASSSLSLSPLG